ncbi:DNA repair protein complementing XP-C cells homolog isoform X2 [Hyposmocoma kahamanoa]|uniref:DNA repair protein complementing XP-C cells homolog isoform X2 n=1 Tax=Hyposmocoma kahamanoa TaxID=1477025 RepID=UPI000E6D8B88|nr:DNA repair protein complementing XP-C cells homolog isoform X2 [Hyposmocoma kahamanoa]
MRLMLLQHFSLLKISLMLINFYLQYSICLKVVWSYNMPDNSEEVAQKTFMELEHHKAKIEETKATLLNYTAKFYDKEDLDVKDLLAQGEEKAPHPQGSENKNKKSKKAMNVSDSDMEDWEEVKEAKGIPQQGLQLVVGIPDAVCKRSKKLDIEMMMKRKINRVKKENQVYMHKVHVLCWLGHGNFVSRVLNDQELLAAALSLVPSKECYPEVNEDVSPPKRARKSRSPRPISTQTATKQVDKMVVDLPQKTSNKKKHQEELENYYNRSSSSIQNKQVRKRSPSLRQQTSTEINIKKEISKSETAKMPVETNNIPSISSRKTRNARKDNKKADKTKSEQKVKVTENKTNAPEIIVTDENKVASKYFDRETPPAKKLSLSRKRSQTALPSTSQKTEMDAKKKTKLRTRSTPGNTVEESKYFIKNEEKSTRPKTTRQTKQEVAKEDTQRVSHKDLLAKNKPKSKNDVREDLIGIMKSRVKEAFQNSKRGKVKGKVKEEHDEDSDYLPVESPKHRDSESDEDFKPTKISPRPSTSGGRKIDRRVLSSDEETPSIKSDIWCEIYVEELEQWICVDVIKGKVHCINEIYNRATHPVNYVVGWDNNNYIKDLTRRYAPHWNTVTRKQRVESSWWEVAVRPWLGPKSARDKEEDEQLNRMQLEAPLPKSIAEYKNHPLYALKRHLLKFEAIYPPDAATLGFVRGEAVYARECVYVCRSRDTWLKEAKVVRLGEQPYKVVKARPKWDRLSNKLITDKPLEIFGPWQVQDYEPPVAENGIVPRNAYGNVELFKDCMLPKGTVHIKLPGLNRVAKKLNIDCAPAMTGFDFNGGWTHPVFDGFVVCKEYEEVITEAWLKDQEDQERREREKIENRVYGNWKRLIKGLFIRERLKNKYGFQEPTPSTSQEKNKKGPRLVVKKK